MDKAGHLIEVFTRLGAFLSQFPDGVRVDSGELAALNEEHYRSFGEALEKEHLYNPWFTPDHVKRALSGISRMLEEKTLRRWLEPYELAPGDTGEGKTVGLVLAGNIPLVGFHDIMSVLVTGHRVLAKASSKDERLVKQVAGVIRTIDPRMGDRIRFTGDRLNGMDAVIATGSDNSARYFDYYFRNTPHIIRKNRNGVAVLTGKETSKELSDLAEDIFTYFGLGCRNVTKLFVPRDFDLKLLMGVVDRYSHLARHHKYANNVEYYRSIYLMNRVDFLDNGILLLKEDSAISSPVGVVFYERYVEIGTVVEKLEANREAIQCIVSLHAAFPNGIPPGTTQDPMPWDYADGVDTVRFLTELR